MAGSIVRKAAGVIKRLQARLPWTWHRDLVFLLVLILLAGGVWAFAEIADEVLEGETRNVDQYILLALRNPDDLADPIGPRWLEEIGRDLTALGGVAVMVLLVIAVVGYLLLQRKRHLALLVTLAVGSGVGFSILLKIFFQRPRPELVPHGSEVFTTSFPSGHSMMAAIVYLTLAALLARNYHRTQMKLYFLSVAVLLTGLVGISRIYVGVHWPTDVLAGWTAGAFWAILWWGIGYYLQTRKIVENTDDYSDRLT